MRPSQGGHATAGTISHLDMLRCGISNRPMSVAGLVSRVTPVHTAVRNCTRDEGGFFEFGNQVLQFDQGLRVVADAANLIGHLGNEAHLRNEHVAARARKHVTDLDDPAFPRLA
jgi:hypothetical protein